MDFMTEDASPTMHDLLQDALDDLVSTRTSHATKGDALRVIEQVLANTCTPGSTTAMEYFNALQDTFQCNVPSRLLSWIATTSSRLETLLARGSGDRERDIEISTISAQLCQAMSIMQGVALTHKPSKRFLARRYGLEVFLDVLMVSRHLTSEEPPTPQSSTAPPAATLPLPSSILDTLLCILVDSSPALRTFEELNGVQIVVKILKRAGTAREVRMKCLEFLYFYLMDETATIPVSMDDDPTPAVPLSPTSTTSRSSGPPSRSASVSSTTSSIAPKPTPAQKTSSPFPRTTRTPSSTVPAPPPAPAATVIPGLRPSTRTVTPTTGRAQPRSLLMLKKDVEYEPLSPKKPQIGHLGVSRPSKLRERTNEGKQKPTPFPHTSVLSSEDTDHEDVVPRSPHGRLQTPFRTPRPQKTHSRGLSATSSAPFLPESPTKAKAPAAADRTPRNAPLKHRRAQSMLEVGSPAPESPLSGLVGGRSASAGVATGGARTMAEKKEILGTMLGNVDALVDSVQKAGIWGLN